MAERLDGSAASSAGIRQPGAHRRPDHPPGPFGKVWTTLEMIKFEHSVFALPFALTGALLAAHGWPGWRAMGWIVVAMVSARTAAMTFNRIADYNFDAANPRTQLRALPAGRLTVRFAGGFTAVSCAVFLAAAFELNRLAFELAPLALLILIGYSYTKRFTWLSHLGLGLSLGISPVGAWIAVRGDVKTSVVLLGAAVTLWVAGFDLIYACQDVDFDRRVKLQSVPARFGIPAALRISLLLHVLTIALLIAAALAAHLGWTAGAGLVAISLLFVYEHSLVKPRDLSRVNAAFFTINGAISFLVLATWAVDIFARK